MTALSGIFGIAVCLLLPGGLLLELIKPRVHYLAGFVLICAVSLTLNHLLVCLLVSIGMYVRSVFICLVIVQVIAVIILVLRSDSQTSQVQSTTITQEFDWTTLKSIIY